MISVSSGLRVDYRGERITTEQCEAIVAFQGVRIRGGPIRASTTLGMGWGGVGGAQMLIYFEGKAIKISWIQCGLWQKKIEDDSTGNNTGLLKRTYLL